jgi:hypothetical protein
VNYPTTDSTDARFPYAFFGFWDYVLAQGSGHKSASVDEVPAILWGARRTSGNFMGSVPEPGNQRLGRKPTDCKDKRQGYGFNTARLWVLSQWW